jgi:hypothetical protein
MSGTEEFELDKNHPKASTDSGQTGPHQHLQNSNLNLGSDFKTVGNAFGTPIVIKGQTWLPIAEIGLWVIMVRYAGQKKPARSWPARLGVGALTTSIILGSEWCHNLAHAAAAQYAGKPMDALLVNWGMPRLVYLDLEDSGVTPRQHIIRALGGPIINTSLLGLYLALRMKLKSDGLAYELADIAVRTNTFISGVSLLPIPGIDGGPILKWSLVEGGQTCREADETVRKVNGVLAALLAAISGILAKRRRRLLAGFFALMAAISLSIAKDWVREEKISPLTNTD